MENTIDTLSKAYDDFVAAINEVLKARLASAGERTPATDAAMEHFRDQLALFRASCDNAEDIVGSFKNLISWDATAAADLDTTPPTDASEMPNDNGGSPASAVVVPEASPPPSSDDAKASESQ